MNVSLVKTHQKTTFLENFSHLLTEEDSKNSKIQTPERSFSKISTIPEEGNEDPDASNDISNNVFAKPAQVPNRIQRLRSRFLNQKKIHS